MKVENVTSKFQVWVSKVSQVLQRQQIGFESYEVARQFDNFKSGVNI